MKRKDDQRDHANSNNGSADEIKRSESRSTRSQNFKKFSTTPPKIGGVTPLLTPPKIGGVNQSTPPKIGGVNEGGYLTIPHSLLEQVFPNITPHSALVVYLYLYWQAFRWVQDEFQITAKCNIELAQICKGCAMSNSRVRDVIKLLEKAGWISIEKRSGKNNIFLIHRYFTPPKIGGDHQRNDFKEIDDFKEIRSSAKSDDSLSIIKKVYKDLTKNTCTNQDTKNYQSLPKNLQTEDIIRYMRAISERIKKPIGSFAYFVKSILRELESPKNKKTNVTKLRKIAESIKTANIGGKSISTTDFIEQVKEIAAREGIPYTPDLLEEALKFIF